jgi:TolA-binding protein
MRKFFRVACWVTLLGMVASVGRSIPAAELAETVLPSTEHRAPSTASEASSGEADDQYLFATELFGKKMYELAIQQYEKFLADHPRHPKAFQARLRVGEANLRLGHSARAVKAYEAALATRPDTTFRGEALVGLGIALFNAREYGRAADALAEARPLVGEDRELGPVAANWMGESLFQLERYADAARAYEGVLRWPQSPHAPQALYAFGYCRLKQGETSGAIATFRRLAKEYSASPLAGSALARAGEALLEEKKYDEAEALFQDARKVSAAEQKEIIADADWGLAGVAFARRRYGTARERYEVFRKEHPESPRAPEAALRIADCYYNEQQYAEAAKAYAAVAAGRSGASRDEAESSGRPPAGVGRPTSLPAVRREASYWEAMSRWKAGERDAAAALFRQLAAEGSKETHAQRARLRLGELEAGRGDLAAAEAAYRACADADPSGHEAGQAVYALAALGFRQKKYAEAEQGFTDFVKRYPKNSQVSAARLAIAQCRWERREFAGARDALLDALDGMPRGETHAGALLLLGRCHARLGEDPKAEMAWKTVVETYPKSATAPRALAALADWYAEKGRDAEAERARADLGERFPNAAASIASRQKAGDAELRKGRPEAAIRQYQAALAGDPEASVAVPLRLSLATAALRAEKPDLVLAEGRKVLDAPPDSDSADQARLLMAGAHEQHGRREEAMALYRAVADRTPPGRHAPTALLRLGRIQSDAKQYGEARATLARLPKEHPKSPLLPDALFELGWSASESGDVDAASAAWERLLKEHPTHSLAADAAFRLGEEAYAAKRYEAAAGYYRRVTEAKEPGEAGDKSWYKLGWCHRQLGRHEAAAAAFRTLFTRYPKSDLALESRLRAAEALLEQGRATEARELFAAVVAGGDGTPAGPTRDSASGGGHVLRARLGLAMTRLKAGEAGGISDLRALARTANRQVGAEAQFRIGEALLARRDYGAAVEEFLRVTLLFKAYPAWAAPAQYQIGESYRLMGKAKEAREAYRRCVESYAGSRWADLSRQRLGSAEPPRPPGVS